MKLAVGDIIGGCHHIIRHLHNLLLALHDFLKSEPVCVFCGSLYVKFVSVLVFGALVVLVRFTCPGICLFFARGILQYRAYPEESGSSQFMHQ